VKKICLLASSWTLTVLMLAGMPIRAQGNASNVGAAKVKFVAVEPGVKLEVLDWGGTGRPVVLLAGLGNDAHVFDTFAQKLTGKYHVYGITRRGYGASDTPPVEGENYSADRLGDDVIAVLDDLKLERPVLVGHSIAGEELSSIGSRYPERVAGLVYLDAGYQYALYDASRGDYWIDTNELRRQLIALNKLLSAASASKTVDEIVKELPNYEKELLAHQKELASYLPLTPEQTKAEAARMNKRDAISGSAILHGEQRYTAIRCPVLAIFSEPHAFSPGSSISPKEKTEAEAADVARVEPQAKAFEALGPNVLVVRIPHADHYVFRSNEADVLREMSAFIANLN
jgi:non-heme chloroperoxidase